ncbi:hypothetical protein FJD35_03785 [Pseudomonas mandelii]|nr:hypothetical protein FJD35_03785 [Pseudomonas mandelii]
MGASLLAKASCQPLSRLADTPLSRAGSLPQGTFLAFRARFQAQKSPRCRTGNGGFSMGLTSRPECPAQSPGSAAD